MKKKKQFSDFSRSELMIIMEELENYYTLEDFWQALDEMLNPNYQIDREAFESLGFFTADELKVIDSYEIMNLQELIDFNLSFMKGVPQSILDKFELVRTCCDTRGMVSEDAKPYVKKGVNSDGSCK